MVSEEPTSKQIAYLEKLTADNGVEFEQPRTKSEASSAIARLLAPKPSQLKLLRSLAERTGTSFTYPKTKREAEVELTRMQALNKRDPHRSIQRSITAQERKSVRGDCQTMVDKASQFRDEEVVGYGSSARWA